MFVNRARVPPTSVARRSLDGTKVIRQSDLVPQRAEHWERVYAKRSTSEVSWYQREPSTSLRLTQRMAAGTASTVIDVGGGASLLVDGLSVRGFNDVTVLDVSQRALDEVETRLGERATSVNLVRRGRREASASWRPARARVVATPTRGLASGRPCSRW